MPRRHITVIRRVHEEHNGTLYCIDYSVVDNSEFVKHQEGNIIPLIVRDKLPPGRGYVHLSESESLEMKTVLGIDVKSIKYKTSNDNDNSWLSMLISIALGACLALLVIAAGHYYDSLLS